MILFEIELNAVDLLFCWGQINWLFCFNESVIRMESCNKISELGSAVKPFLIQT